MGKQHALLRGELLILASVVMLILLAWLQTKQPASMSLKVATQTVTPSPEPIVPTQTPSSADTVPRPISSTLTVLLTAGPLATATSIAATARPALARSQAPVSSLWQGRPRWGVGVPREGLSISDVDVGPLRLGWYLDWQTQAHPPRPDGAEYAQMVRLMGNQLHPDALALASTARANPGSLWLIGNEPDVKWQDNVEAATYAQLYHAAYTAIKRADATAQVAIGGVTQPSPLRLRYLDQVLAEYRTQYGEPMPVDVWNIHNFTLREEVGSWGVDVPPGFSEKQGVLYEIADSDNLQAFERQLLAFRRWMAERGFRDRPLIVSEYGVLMPADYGFAPERMAVYLKGTFDFMLSAADPALGYPADNNHLVQRWCWYSLSDTVYPTDNLMDVKSRQITGLGQVWAGYVAESR